MGDFRSESPYLQKRYGIKENTFPKWMPFAITFLIAGTIWTIWSGSNHAVPEVRYNLISFNPISAKEIGIRFTVNFKSKDKISFLSFSCQRYRCEYCGRENHGISKWDYRRRCQNNYSYAGIRRQRWNTGLRSSVNLHPHVRDSNLVNPRSS
jgi:hypothetical protein